MASDFEADIAAIDRIKAVPTILDVVCRATGMRFAAVARVTQDRWIACSVKDDIAFGLAPGGELKVETTICSEIRQSGEAVVIDHVSRDDAFCGHPTPALYGFQSYISVPIVMPDGSFFGTLCAIDPEPARVNTPQVVGMFKLFAELIAAHLDSELRLARSQATLMDERKTSELREQFIAVLGHDLRNPLASIRAGTELLVRTPLNERAQDIVALMHRSVDRMAGLVDNVLDFARGRLGDGMTLTRDDALPLEPVLRQVTAELAASHPHRTVEAAFSITEAVSCDRGRIGQLLSNLVGNAIAHGRDDLPVRLRATTEGGVFELSVSNAGDPIPPEVVERLFQPFSRGEGRPHQEGLGLGLYIASEIARAHDGTLTVISDEAETRFTYRMPLDAAGAHTDPVRSGARRS